MWICAGLATPGVYLKKLEEQGEKREDEGMRSTKREREGHKASGVDWWFPTHHVCVGHVFQHSQ